MKRERHLLKLDRKSICGKHYLDHCFLYSLFGCFFFSCENYSEKIILQKGQQCKYGNKYDFARSSYCYCQYSWRPFFRISSPVVSVLLLHVLSTLSEAKFLLRKKISIWFEFMLFNNCITLYIQTYFLL